MSVPTRIVTKLVGCPRCHADHLNLEFKRFAEPPYFGTHWTLCPTTGEPILMTHQVEKKV